MTFGWVGRARRTFDAAVVRRRLGACNELGARAVLRGVPLVTNSGEIFVGDDFRLDSTPVVSHMFVTGRVQIGNRVSIGMGAAISCLGYINIESDVSIGDFVIVLDSDWHMAEDLSAHAPPKPICINRGARIGHRVVVLPGSTIGAGAVVKAGSVVSGEVAPNAIVEGNPARVNVGPAASELAASDIRELVRQVLGLPSVPDLHEGPDQIAQWNSLGMLRLIVALEERFGVVLAEEEVKAVGSIRELGACVQAAQAREFGSESGPR